MNRLSGTCETAVGCRIHTFIRWSGLPNSKCQRQSISLDSGEVAGYFSIPYIDSGLHSRSVVRTTAMNVRIMHHHNALRPRVKKVDTCVNLE